LLGAYAFDGCRYDENLRRRRIEPILLSRSDDGMCREELLIGARQTPCFSMTRVEASGSPFTTAATGRCAILIVTEGKGQLVCGAGAIDIKKGDEVFIGADVRELTYVPDGGHLCAVAAYPPGMDWQAGE